MAGKLIQSAFSYGIELEAEQCLLYFNNNLAEQENISIKKDLYTPQCLMDEINKTFKAIELPYEITYNRATNFVTITNTNGDTFDLLGATSPNAGLLGVLGFDPLLDYTGEISYQSSVPLAKKYFVQFCVQSLLRCEDNKRLKDAVVTESISGKYECFHCGEESFFEFNLRFITDIKQDCSFMYNNPTGVQDARDLFDYMICKRPVEFVPDCDDQDAYYTLVLDQTSESRNGTGYELKEMYQQGLCEYYETGLLRFKCIEKGA